MAWLGLKHKQNYSANLLYTERQTMFSVDFFIDAFQNTKKTATNAIITDTELNIAAHRFIDAQTAFAKMLNKNTETVLKHYTDTQTSLWFPKGLAK